MNYKANTPLRLKMSERCIFMCKSTKLAQCFLDCAIPLNMVKYSCDIISFIQHKLKARQLQVPIFALNTKGAWTLRFDDIIADALEAGALRTEDDPLPDTVIRQVETTDTNGVPKEIIVELICYYLANKQDDTEWVVLPVANFDAYFGNNNLSKKWLAKIPKSLILRENKHGVCRYKVFL